jgi:lipid-A-disaccharide synthase
MFYEAWLVVLRHNKKCVLIIAGEASADLHGSNLVRAMKKINPEISFRGIGGEKMEAAGVEILFTSSQMAVVGLTEVFARLPYILRAYGGLKTLLKTDNPDLIILIDYPAFNVRLARHAKRLHVPVLYYISPQVWAWREGRIKKISRRVDRMSVILPFERDAYRKFGLVPEYVGHPLMDNVPLGLNRLDAIGVLGLEKGSPILGLLPGSRREEIDKLLPPMVEAAEMLSSRYHGLRCLLPLASTVSPSLVNGLISRSSVEIKTIQGDIYTALAACDLALVASGTATLETAIMGIPMIIVYRLSPISYWIGKRVVKVPFIGLVNLVAGEEIVPELIQSEVTPHRLAQEADAILGDGRKKENMIKKLERVKTKLGQGGASEKTARIAIEMMEGS